MLPVPSAAPPDPGVPTPVVRAGSLPHALTFFLTTHQRRAVLRALRTLHRSRETALLRALGVSKASTPDANR